MTQNPADHANPFNKLPPLKPTPSGALRDEFGNTFRSISEPYTCPLAQRVEPLSSSRADHARQGGPIVI